MTGAEVWLNISPEILVTMIRSWESPLVIVLVASFVEVPNLPAISFSGLCDTRVLPGLTGRSFISLHNEREELVRVHASTQMLREVPSTGLSSAHVASSSHPTTPAAFPSHGLLALTFP